jgi:hypothetical protein
LNCAVPTRPLPIALGPPNPGLTPLPRPILGLTPRLGPTLLPSVLPVLPPVVLTGGLGAPAALTGFLIPVVAVLLELAVLLWLCAKLAAGRAIVGTEVDDDDDEDGLRAVGTNPDPEGFRGATEVD